MFLLTQHLQFALGYSPLQAGVQLPPVATLITSAPSAPRLGRRIGRGPVAAAGMLTGAGTGNGYRPARIALALFGVGLGLAMAPATDSIMGALPPAKAGVGSAMNDTTRAVGEAGGVAVLGSVLSSAYTAAPAPRSPASPPR